MVGQLINTFEASEDNTVEAFNKLFDESLDYPSDSIVEIGEMLTGGFRELFIDGKIELITLEAFENKLYGSATRRAIYKYTATKENEEPKISYHLKDMADLLGVTKPTINNAIKKGFLCKGYVVTREFHKRGDKSLWKL